MKQNTKPKKNLQYQMRAIHRVLGYLAVGMVIVYALSGIVLIHRTGDFMKRSSEVTTTLAPGLQADQLAPELKMKSIKVTEETDDAIVFADGRYDKNTGVVKYVKKEYGTPMNKFVDLHKLPDAKNPHIAWLTTTFGVVLFLLAVTSLFMYKPSSKPFKANMIYTAIGVAIAVLLVALV